MQNTIHSLDTIKGVSSWDIHQTLHYYIVRLTIGSELLLSDNDIHTIITDFDSDITAYKAFFDDMYCDFCRNILAQ